MKCRRAFTAFSHELSFPKTETISVVARMRHGLRGARAADKAVASGASVGDLASNVAVPVDDDAVSAGRACWDLLAT